MVYGYAGGIGISRDSAKQMIKLILIISIIPASAARIDFNT
jgi:hypothetical protein